MISKKISNDIIEKNIRLLPPFAHKKLRTIPENETIKNKVRHFISIINAHSTIKRALFKNDELCGYCVLTPLAWDSKHFGINMARMECNFCLSSCTKMEIAETIRHTLDQAKAEGIQHISLSLDAGLQHIISVIYSAGFILTDTKVNYTALPSSKPRKERPTKIRNYEKSDRNTIIEMLSESHIPSRFTNDPAFPASKVSAMYAKWIEKLHSEMGKGGILIVAERRKEIVACGGLSPFTIPGSNTKILGNSFLFSTAKGIGSSHAIVARGINKGLERFPSIIFSTSISNSPMIRLLENHQCHFSGASHMFSWNNI